MGPANALIAKVVGSGMSSNEWKRSGAFQVEGTQVVPRSANLRNGEVALSSDSPGLAIGEAARAGVEAASELLPVGPEGTPSKLVGAVDPMPAVDSVAVAASTLVVDSLGVAASMLALDSVAVAASMPAVDSMAVAASMPAVDLVAIAASMLAVDSVAVAASMPAVDSVACLASMLAVVSMPDVDSRVVSASTPVVDSVAAVLVSDVPEVAVSSATSTGAVLLFGAPSISAGWMSMVGAGETASGA